jgi:hypothetical protein
LREIRAENMARDGRNDFEEAGLDEEQPIEIENVNEDELLLFEDLCLE